MCVFPGVRLGLGLDPIAAVGTLPEVIRVSPPETGIECHGDRRPGVGDRIERIESAGASLLEVGLGGGGGGEGASPTAAAQAQLARAPRPVAVSFVTAESYALWEESRRGKKSAPKG